MIPLSNYLIVSAILLTISLAGLLINRRSLITMLMCIELLLLAVNTNFVAFAYYINNNVGEVFVFFILTVAAAEAAIGLALIIAIYRLRQSIFVQDISELNG